MPHRPSAMSSQSLIGRDPRARKEAFAEVLKLFPSTSCRVTHAPFEGREGELQEAIELLGSSGSDVQLLVVEGEAGAGKTRLVEELRFRRALASSDFSVGRCFERENRQFEPFLQVISQKLRRRDALSRRWEATEFPRFRHSLDHLLSESQDVAWRTGYRPANWQQMSRERRSLSPIRYGAALLFSKTLTGPTKARSEYSSKSFFAEAKRTSAFS